MLLFLRKLFGKKVMFLLLRNGVNVLRLPLKLKFPRVKMVQFRLVKLPTPRAFVLLLLITVLIVIGVIRVFLFLMILLTIKPVLRVIGCLTVNHLFLIPIFSDKLIANEQLFRFTYFYLLYDYYVLLSHFTFQFFSGLYYLSGRFNRVDLVAVSSSLGGSY